VALQRNGAYVGGFKLSAYRNMRDDVTSKRVAYGEMGENPTRHNFL